MNGREMVETCAMANSKPLVYIASPYSKGDPAINAHFQCKVFDQLLNDGRVVPFAPLWTHFQHTVFPRPYEDWLAYDKALLHLFDCCLRLDADVPEAGYRESDSSGADSEARFFKELGKPVFYSISALYEWLEH